MKLFFTAFGLLRRDWLSGVLVTALGVGVAGCQSSVGEVAAARYPAATVASSVGVATPRPAEAPDSLRPTPVAAVVGMPDSVRQRVHALHRSLGPAAAELRLEVLERACVGYLALREAGRISQPGILAVADMDLPSSTPRLWVLDLRAGRVLHHSRVAHGRGSGHLRAQRFSNTVKSACTAGGFYRTQDTYQGKHGLSRRLRGLDAGLNDNALRRYVVLHAADYVSDQYVARYGQAGYSRGCPALPPDQYRAIIATMREGSCLYLSGPTVDSGWCKADVAGQQLAAHGWN